MRKEVRIVIGSDICPTPGDIELFEKGRVDVLLPKELLDMFVRADFSIVNIESPLTDASTCISKMGPALKASPASINFYRAIGVSAACLANNHILDYGDQGVADTLSAFKNAGILTVGAGTSLEAARKPLLYRFAVGPIQRTLAVVAMAEREFCIAGNASAGANPIDFINFSLVRDLKRQYDKVLVLLHGGTELLSIPRPGLIDLCHFLVDQGADSVIVQHTHCVGGVERYRSGNIVYGQGNFIFGKLTTRDVLPTDWWEGMIVELLWDVVSDELELKTHPFMQISDGVGLRLLNDAETQAFETRQQELAVLIRDRTAIEREWRKFCTDSRDRVLLNLMGAGRIPRALAKRGLPLVRIWSQIANLRLIRNFISCESHRELTLEALGSLPQEKLDV